MMLAALAVVGCFLIVRSDPRRLRAALAASVTALIVGDSLLLVIVTGISTFSSTAGAIALAVAVVMLGLGVLVLAGYLVATGVTVVRREGRSLAHLVALVMGLGILAYLMAVAMAVRHGWSTGMRFLLALGVPVLYLGWLFVSFVGYGMAYTVWATKAWRGPVVAVVVLGAGLVHGQVGRLLSARLARGQLVYERAAQDGRRVVIVPSGGQGADEPRPEAEAMAEKLVSSGVPLPDVWQEDRSTNTEENLTYSAALLTSRGITGPIAVATSNYHVYRAAMLMSRLGIAGHAVGARTAGYYWPTAVVREFVAVLREHWIVHLVIVAVTWAASWWVWGVLFTTFG